MIRQDFRRGAAFTLAALALLAGAAAADAQYLVEKARPRWTASLDYYDADGIRSKDKALAAKGLREVTAAGFTGKSSAKTTAGAGVSVGILLPLGGEKHVTDEGLPDFEVGGRLSYLRGPRSTVSITGHDSSGPGRFDFKDHFDAWRLLLLGNKPIRLNERLKAEVGGGLGMARESAGYTASGSGSLAQNTESKSRTRTKVTWELSAALTYDAGGLPVSLGVRYAMFPTLHFLDSEIAPVQWKPWGVFIAVSY